MGKSYSIAVILRGKDFLSETLGRVGRVLGRLSGSVANVGRTMGKGFGGFIEKLPGLSVAFGWAKSAGKTLFDLAKGASDVGSAINDLSVRTGIGTRALQEVGYAADQAGVPLEEFGAGLQTMARVLGKGVKANQLRMLGADAYRFTRALKAAPDATAKFELVLSTMASISDPTKRAAFAATLFGKSGVKLAAVAGDGADGLKAMRAEAEALGLVMAEDDIKRADEFGDTLGSLEKTFGGMKSTFGAGLIEGVLPELKDLLGMVKSNRKEVGAFIRDLGRKVGTGIVDGAKAIASAFKWIYEHRDEIITWAERLAVIIGTIKVGGLLGDLGKLGGGLLGGGGATGGIGGSGALGGILGGGAMGALSVAGAGMLAYGAAQFIDTYFPSEEERKARQRAARGEKAALLYDRSQSETLAGTVPALPKGLPLTAAQGSFYLANSVVETPTAAQVAQAQAYQLARGGALARAAIGDTSGSGIIGAAQQAGIFETPAPKVPIEVLLRIQDPGEQVAATSVKAPKNAKVTVRTGKAGSMKAGR